MDYFSSERLREGLRKKAIRGGTFTVLAQAVQVVLGFAIVPLLARLLDRPDFGVAVKVTAITGLASLLVDAGLSFATVQRAELNHRQSSNLFWLSSGLGLALGTIVAAMGPLVSVFYSDPRLVTACLLLGCAYPFSGLAMQHQALLVRGLQYDRIAIVRVVAFATSNAGCVLLAWHWQNYWALLWRPVLEAVVRAAMVWLLCPWRPGLPRRGSGVRGIVGFGAGVTGASVISYLASQIDNILLGRYWTDDLTGLYERSMRCMMAPLQQAQGPIQTLVTPVLSRLSNEPERQKTAYLMIVTRMLCIAGPLVAMLMIQSEAFILTVLGDKYADAVPIFAWLTLAGLVQPIAMSLRWMMLYQGRGAELVRLAAINGAIAISTISLGLPWGPVGVAASLVLGGVVLRLPIAIWLSCRGSNISAAEILRAVLGCLPLSMAVAAANLLIFQWEESLSPLLLLVVSAVASLAVWLAVLPFSPVRPMLVGLASQLRNKNSRSDFSDLTSNPK